MIRLTPSSLSKTHSPSPEKGIYQSPLPNVVI